jgi:hypothetical protein
MDPRRNPYNPGAGRTPAALVGRDGQRDAWSVALDRVEAGRDAQPVVLYGLRGVGKTVLLNAFRTAAEDQNWLAAAAEAGSGKTLREALGEALHGPLADIASPSVGQRVRRALRTAVSFKASYDTSGSWNFGLDLTDGPGGGADTGVLETDLGKLVKDLALGAAESGVGLAILIDEAQDLAPDELVAVCQVAHEASQRQWPVLIALAGLPSLPRVLAEAKSYAERLFMYERIEQLPEDLARQALVDPAAQEGATWDDKAVRHVVTQTQGYPYFVQQFGQDIWNAAPTSTITLQDARVGSERALATLDTGFFRARWDRATKSEKQYLRAMAPGGDAGAPTSDVAARMGRKLGSLGPARASLINKGLIYAPEHGVVQFTVPGMADFITRQPG